MANVLWLFYMSKILDFMDTLFIVLGKKWEQLSFLHVYHHTTIFLVGNPQHGHRAFGCTAPSRRARCPHT